MVVTNATQRFVLAVTQHTNNNITTINGAPWFIHWRYKACLGLNIRKSFDVIATIVNSACGYWFRLRLSSWRYRAMLLLWQESSAKLTNQRVSYAFTSSPFNFPACHILPASKFQYSYSCILLIFYWHQWTACIRTVSVNTVHWFDASSSGNPNE